MTPEEAKRLEKQAHRFAAAFLTPADPLLDDWGTLGGRVTLGVLQKLKATWGVAIKMLVVRFRQLGIIDDEHARSLYRQISARGWSTSEPVQVSNEEPVWLDKALASAFPAASREQSQVEAAKHFGLDPEHLSRWTTWSAPQRGGPRVIDLRRGGIEGRTSRRTETARSTGTDADVISLTPRGSSGPTLGV